MRQPNRAQATIAVAIWPPGAIANPESSAFESGWGQSAIDREKIEARLPRSDDVEGLGLGGGSRTGQFHREPAQGGLIFAFSLRIVRSEFRHHFGGTGAVQPLTKRQREILDYLQEFIQQHGYAPSLEEIGERFSLSSLATVHKHLTNLQEKGFIRRSWNRSRSVELLSARTGHRAIDLPLLGYVAAGAPIEAVASNETIAVPEDLVGKRETYVLRVKGDSMIDEQIRDGDFVVVEDRKTADNGEMVIALVGGTDVTLKKFYRENGRVRLQPANPTMQPIILDASHVQLQGVVVGVMRRY